MGNAPLTIRGIGVSGKSTTDVVIAVEDGRGVWSSPSHWELLGHARAVLVVH